MARPKRPTDDLEIEELPAPEMVPELSDPAAQRRAAEIELTKPRKRIDVSLLLASGRFLHQDNEAAAFQKMSPGHFSTLMSRRDPDTGLTYRHIFDNARSHGRASLLRRMIELGMQDKNPSAAVTAMKYIMANEFGWSERSVEERTGSVKHMHAHLHAIPKDTDLQLMSEQQLLEMALGQTGKPSTRH